MTSSSCNVTLLADSDLHSDIGPPPFIRGGEIAGKRSMLGVAFLTIKLAAGGPKKSARRRAN